MPRTLALLILLMGCSALALFGGLRNAPAAFACSAGRDAPEPRFARPWSGSRDCKPRAPVELQLEQTGASDRSVVTLQFRVLPHDSVGVVDWELQLPAGAQLLQGELRGSCTAGGDGSGSRVVHVRLDPDADLSRITLSARGALVDAPTDGNLVRARSALTWGDPQAALVDKVRERPLLVVGPRVSRRVAEVPSVHRSGR